MPTRLDIIAWTLLDVLARGIPPERVGFVYKRRGGDGDGLEQLVEQETRELADVEARRFEKELGCELVFVREHKAPPAPAPPATPARPKTASKKRPARARASKPSAKGTTSTRATKTKTRRK